MDSVKRSYYPDGTLKEETHYRDNKEHGMHREWHPNGVLAREVLYENGLFADYAWKRWNDRGILQSEIQWFSGRQIGRLLICDDEGVVVQERFFLESGEVSRAKYEAAARSRPELPRYPEAGPRRRQQKVRSAKSAGGAVSSELPEERTSRDERAEEAFIGSMLNSRNTEALDWLRGSTPKAWHTLGQLAVEESVEFVQRLYTLGSDKVLAVEIEDIPGTDHQATEHLLVKLPADQDSRDRIFAVENERALSEGFDGEVDHGQAYLYFRVRELDNEGAS